MDLANENLLHCEDQLYGQYLSDEEKVPDLRPRRPENYAVPTVLSEGAIKKKEADGPKRRPTSSTSSSGEAYAQQKMG